MESVCVDYGQYRSCAAYAANARQDILVTVKSGDAMKCPKCHTEMRHIVGQDFPDDNEPPIAYGIWYCDTLLCGNAIFDTDDEYEYPD